MKTSLIALLTAASLIAFPAFADTPNRTTMTFKQFVEAYGCVIKDNAAGQSNIYSVNGGNCPIDVAAAFNPAVDSDVETGL